MVFRMTSLEILKGLSIGGNSGNTHFVRCVRPTLDYKPRAFQVCLIKWLCDNHAAQCKVQITIEINVFNFPYRMIWFTSKYVLWPFMIQLYLVKKDFPNVFASQNSSEGKLTKQAKVKFGIKNRKTIALYRYKFLAFEFDENVDMTKDNCRLLLIRLKMEGWAIGRSKVFLKYYNVEYLSR